MKIAYAFLNKLNIQCLLWKTDVTQSKDYVINISGVKNKKLQYCEEISKTTCATF